MHEISVASAIIDELQAEGFKLLELDVSALSLHNSEHSRHELEEILQERFPAAKVSVRMVKPMAKCSCGFSSVSLNSMDCPKCGKRMKLEVFEGYRVTRKG